MVAIPERKISETILDFGEPLLSHFPDDVPLKTLHEAFKTVILIWNAHVMATPVWGKPGHLRDLEKAMKGPTAPPEMESMVRHLTKRWLDEFRDDPRAVGHWKILRDAAGELRFRCEARVPHGLLAGAKNEDIPERWTQREQGL